MAVRLPHASHPWQTVLDPSSNGIATHVVTCWLSCYPCSHLHGRSCPPSSHRSRSRGRRCSAGLLGIAGLHRPRWAPTPASTHGTYSLCVANQLVVASRVRHLRQSLTPPHLARRCHDLQTIAAYNKLACAQGGLSLGRRLCGSTSSSRTSSSASELLRDCLPCSETCTALRSKHFSTAHGNNTRGVGSAHVEHYRSISDGVSDCLQAAEP